LNRSGGGGSSSSALIYYSAESSSRIQAAGLNGSTLVPLALTTPTQSINARMIFVKQMFLYATLGNGVEAFTLARPTGALTNILGNLASYPAHGNTLAADPRGRFLFVSGPGSSIDVFEINSVTGALTAAPGTPFSARLSQIAQLTVDASGNFLYASDGNSMTSIFSIAPSTGALAEVSGSPLSLGVACIQASQGGEFLVGIPTCFGLGAPDIHVFSIPTSTGIPTEISGSPFPTMAAVFNFAVSPTGQFVYTFGHTSSSSSTVAPIEGYQMDATTGALTAVSRSPFRSLPTVVNCFFDQSGVTLLCSDTLRLGNFYAMAVDPKTGIPSLQATLPITSSNPIDLMYAITD
jgi:6-phosphogluconolactonase (cycloisomerase 2 family)